MSRASGFDHPGHPEASTERARRLRQQADWCVGMAAKVVDPRMFHTYVEAATAFQRQAAALEGGGAAD